MIHDIYFKRFPVDLGAAWQMELIPPKLAKIKSADGKVAVSLSGTQVAHNFSTSNQPLSAKQVNALRELQREAANRPFLFRNPFHHSVSFPPIVTDYGTMVTGALIKPAQSIFTQPVIVFASESLDTVVLRPVVSVANVLIDGTAPIAVPWNPVTKEAVVEVGINSGLDSLSRMRFASFDYFIPVRMTQFEVSPVRNTRSLNTSCDRTEYTASITLEEDVTVGLPIVHSWQRNDAVQLT